jgi:hypothetical protein
LVSEFGFISRWVPLPFLFSMWLYNLDLSSES